MIRKMFRGSRPREVDGESNAKLKDPKRSCVYLRSLIFRTSTREAERLENKIYGDDR